MNSQKFENKIPSKPCCDACRSLDEKYSKVTLVVPEMDCQEEVKAIKKEFGKLSSLLNMEFYPVSREIKVVYTGGKSELEGIIEAVTGLGMACSVKADKDSDKNRNESRSHFILVTISVLLALAGLWIKIRYESIFPSFPLFIGAVLVGGWHIFRRAVLSIKHFNMDMNVLVLLAVMGAFALGDMGEAASVVILFAIAQILEMHSMERARRAIKGLMDLAPDFANVKRDGEILRVSPQDIDVGEIILVRPGEKIPLDGEVVSGESTVNQSSVTGESIPRYKGPGDKVFAGTLNQNGAMVVRVTHISCDTTIAHIVEMVEEAQAHRAPAQNFVDCFARYYTPAVIVAAILTAVVPALFFNQDLGKMVYRALVLLLISCPCALVISTPVSIVSGLTRAAKDGVLIKGGMYLETLSRIKVLALDKTGTLTWGKPRVTNIIPVNSMEKGELLGIAAAVESFSEHPIGEAIVRMAKDERVKIPVASDFQSITGIGAGAKIDSGEYFVGSHRYFCEKDLCRPNIHHRIVELERNGETVVVVGNSMEILGLLTIADTLRDEAFQAIKEVRSEGVERVVMLTGDNNGIAEALASKLEIEYRGELLPADKVNFLDEFKRERGLVAMVGDGVNDAPALAAASVGLAMGAAGSNTALDVADVALMSDDLTKIPYALRLSRRTLGIIKENIVLAIFIKGIFLILGFLGLATLWMAVFADMGASLIVILNGLRLLGFKYIPKQNI